MYLRSLYPPVPPLPSTNYLNVLMNQPDMPEVPDHDIFIDAITGQKRTRSEYMDRLFDAATALGAPPDKGGLGLTSKNIIGILSDNCIDYTVLIHALFAITTPFALFSTYATPREMNHYLTKSKATHMFVHAALIPQFLVAAREAGFPEEHIYILEGTAPSSPRLRHFDQLIQHARQNNIIREPVRPAGKDTLAYLVFSSGTSGLPKAVMVSHGNLIFSFVQAAIVAQEYFKVANPPLDLSAIPVVLAFLPLFHSFGLHFTCLRVIARPTTIVLMPRWNLNVALAAIPKYRVNVVPAVPSILHQFVNSPQFEKTDLSSVVTFGSGAAYCPPKLVDTLMKKLPQHVGMGMGYGLSETTIAAIGNSQEGLLDGRAEHIPTSTGLLHPGLEALILRPDGTHCLPMEPGELFLKGDNVTLGYWDNPEATKETFLPNGWIRTGDRFKASTRGTFFFEDRVKDTLKVSGLQVSPAEIEDLLHAEPNDIVSDVAVAGVQTPGARTSDDRSPRAWVVLTAHGRKLGEREAREKLENWTRKHLSKYKWLRGGIQFVSEIPKGPSGKTLRRVLQDQYAAESARAKL
ncbi:acetyl-CoA synthetase-like protein [Ramaria rubella]|nr:acetyl-CoA synthetase-like protein [Ramaria rubella]